MTSRTFRYRPIVNSNVMCYRGTNSAEIDAEDAEVTSHEEPGRFGERNYHRHRQSTSKTVRASADTQGVIGRIKALFTV